MQSGERIKVLDSHCGSGKTSYIINYINSLDEDSNIIYITPFLSETERIKRECPDKKFVLPDSRLGKGSKLNHFMELVAKGKNIASTHALFSNINDELIELLRSQNYILVLDEVMNVVSQLDLYKDDSRKTDYEKELLTKQDVIALISQKIILVADDGLVSWSSEVPLLNKYVQLKELADREMLYYMNDDLLIWTFPIEVFMEGIFQTKHTFLPLQKRPSLKRSFYKMDLDICLLDKQELAYLYSRYSPYSYTQANSLL